MPDLKERVFEALNNAKENGYDFLTWSLSHTIQYLKAYNHDLEEAVSTSLIPLIEEWRKLHV